MSLLLKWQGHLVENHSSPKTPPRPLELLALVYMCSVGFGRSKIWMPFQACMYDSHHHMSACAYAGTYLRLKLDWNIIKKWIRP